LHGKTRRGALVFDVADLIKDWLVMPAAFSYGKNGAKDNEFRADLIERAQDNEVLDMLITFIKSRLENIK
jgi:CRISPR-associated protein Cas1